MPNQRTSEANRQFGSTFLAEAPERLKLKLAIAWGKLAEFFTKTKKGTLLGLCGLSLITIIHFPLPSQLIDANIQPCETPSLARGQVHVVLGGYRRSERGLDFASTDPTKNYLWDLQLTNADIFWYRRIDRTQPLQQIQGQCGMTIHERLLLPNHGREGAAFYDYAVEHYHNPPKMLVFLHGHGAIAWHLSCDSVFARTAYYYRALARQKLHSKYMNGSNPSLAIDRDTGSNKTVANHMMTFTSDHKSTIHYTHNWYGRPNKKRRLGIQADGCLPLRNNPKWAHLLSQKETQGPFASCCASFVMPGDRIQRFPIEMWEYLRDFHLDDSLVNGETRRTCWEFIAYRLLGESIQDYNQTEALTYYDEADSLIHGKLRSPSSPGPDKAILKRVQTCKKAKDGKKAK